MGEFSSLKDLMVQRGLALDTKAAIALILAGKVLVNDQKIDKPGTRVSSEAKIRLKGLVSKYVSRAGDKLEGLVTELDLNGLFKGATVLDVGSSTGGFTDFSVQNGAKAVFAVDVGTNQLDWKLRNDSRVHVFEKTDIKNFEPQPEIHFDVIVCDVSFTSVAFILDALKALASHSTYFLILIKPQFEADRSDVEPGGLVTNEHTRKEVIARTLDTILAHHFYIIATRDSVLKGRKGNLEAWVVCKLCPSPDR